jgi:hypothetical protein
MNHQDNPLQNDFNDNAGFIRYLQPPTNMVQEERPS